EDEEVVFELAEDLGELRAGDRLTFTVSGEPSARSYLPVEVTDASVLAVDGRGRPALLRNELGSGATVLCTYPVEHFAARTPAVNPESTWRLYSALATLAGVARPVRVDDPRVLAGVVRHGADATALLMNCSADT